MRSFAKLILLPLINHYEAFGDIIFGYLSLAVFHGHSALQLLIGKSVDKMIFVLCIGRISVAQQQLFIPHTRRKLRKSGLRTENRIAFPKKPQVTAVYIWVILIS